MNNPLLSVRGLSVSAGVKKIVTDISFDVHEGEVLGLFGDSGCGKSTILHTLFGLQHGSFKVEGDILFRGHSILHKPAELRSHLGISIVFQDLGLFDDRNIFENVAYPLRQRGDNEALIASKTNSVLSFLQISNLANRNPGQVSGGQRQRVALARALVYKPQLLLLDEPLRGLQEELKFQFLAFMRAIERNNTALIFVTHERSELELIADNIIMMSKGKLERHEKRTDGKTFRSLVSTALIPDPENLGSYCRVADLKISFSQHSAPSEYQIIVNVKEWRPLCDGRRGALIQYSNSELGWLIFDSIGSNVNDLPLGQICLAYKKIGDYS